MPPGFPQFYTMLFNHKHTSLAEPVEVVVLGLTVHSRLVLRKPGFTMASILCLLAPVHTHAQKAAAEISVLLFIFIFTLARAEGNPLFLFYILNIQRTYFKQNGIIFAEISLSSLSHETIFPRSRFDLGE